MLYRVLIIALLLGCFCSIAQAQPAQQLTVKFNWTHDGQFTNGFRLYKGGSPGALLKVADIAGGSTRTFTYSGLEQFPVCFGISAIGPTGESAVMTKDQAGVDVCLGKPQAPGGFSFSVQ